MRLPAVLRFLVCLAVVIGLASVATAADDALPYTAYVVTGEADVRSGPDDSFYLTERLIMGTEVEVHRLDPGGWLAIRPPAESFCWMPANKVRLTDQADVAEVIADDAVAWMGSNLETVKKHRWQVRLERGERVAILGHDARNDADGPSRTWFRIAAPAGEFRWIHKDDLRRSRPSRASDVLRATAQIRTSAVPAAADPRSEPIRPVAATSLPTASSADSTNWVSARKRTEGHRLDYSDPRAVEHARFQTEATQSATALRSAPTILPTAGSAADSAQPPATSSPSTARDLRGDTRVVWSPRNPQREAQQLDQLTNTSLAPSPLVPTGRNELELERDDIELQFSLLASRDPQLWNLAALRGRSEALVERGQTPLERGQARLLLEQIEAFEDLYERHVQVERGVVVPAATGVSASGTSKPRTALSRVEPRFDGSGWLVPVHSTRRSAPPYALSDDSGNVVLYVAPAPGLNLHRYERKRVGIYGQRNSVTDLSAQVLTAHRVIDLGRETTR